MNGQDQKTIEKLQAQQNGRNIADKVGRAASTYVGGAKGAKLYDAASKTKLGQSTLDGAGNKLAKSSFIGKKTPKKQSSISNASTNLENDNVESKTPLDSLVGAVGGKGIFQTIKTGLYVKIAAFSTGVILFIILIVIIMVYLTQVISPFVYMDDKFSETGEKLFNLFSGCGWSTEEECNAKLENDFYEEIDKVYEKIKREKAVEINKNLLAATLTYVDPYLTLKPINGGSDAYSSSLIDFKKNKNQVKPLAEEMIREVEFCYLKDKKDDSLLSVDCSLKDYDQIKYEFVKTKRWVVDLEKYRKYLQEKYVIKYYLDNNGELAQEAIDITNEIFNRVAFYEDLKANQRNTPEFFLNNSTMVTITDANGVHLEQVTLKDYLYGVVYAYMDDDSSEEYLKFLAVAAKNYLYFKNGSSKTITTQNLYIQNTDSNQIYCSIARGCHYREDMYGYIKTMITGEDKKGVYFKPPVDDTNTIRKIRNAIDNTTNDFIVKGDKLINTKYRAENIDEVLNQLKKSDYKEALVAIYGGTVDEINMTATGYPLDLQNNRVTSGFGWRFHPTAHVCRTHNGMDIGATKNSNIYSIANGIVTEIGYQPNKATGLGNYVVIGHGTKVGDYYEYYSLYAHMIDPAVVDYGQHVNMGQVVGNVGMTGASTGYHLHIEIYSYVNGAKVRQDPATYFKNVQLTGVTGPMYNDENECLNSKEAL